MTNALRLSCPTLVPLELCTSEGHVTTSPKVDLSTLRHLVHPKLGAGGKLRQGEG